MPFTVNVLLASILNCDVGPGAAVTRIVCKYSRSDHVYYRWPRSIYRCKKKLTGLHDSYHSWHLYICRFLFGLSTFL